MFRCQFNTAFIPPNNCLEFGKWELSPEDIRKDKEKKIKNSFRLKLYFKDFCKKCSPTETEIENLCPACIAEMGPLTLNQWKGVTQIMKRHNYPSLEQGDALLPFNEEGEMQTSMNQTLQFDWNYYRNMASGGRPNELPHQLGGLWAK